MHLHFKGDSDCQLEKSFAQTLQEPSQSTTFGITSYLQPYTVFWAQQRSHAAPLKQQDHKRQHDNAPHLVDLNIKGTAGAIASVKHWSCKA
jgi:hypothetical protein